MSDHWYANPTQIYYTCRALALGQTLNHMDVVRGVKSWRLAAIVCTLRKEYAWPILREDRGPENIAHYFFPSPATRFACIIRHRRGFCLRN